jgi:phosphate transport system permease protein
MTALVPDDANAPTLEQPAVEDIPRQVEDRPRRGNTSSASMGEAAVAAGAAVAGSLALRLVLGWDGIMGTALWAGLIFLVVIYLILRDRHGREPAVDRVVTVLIWSAALTVIAVLVWMMAYLTVQGVKLLRVGFLTQDLSSTGALDKGGGMKHAIIGTLEQVLIATAAVVPIAVFTAVYLNEIRGRMSTPIRFIVDALSGLPSIVAGLLIFTIWVVGRGFSGIAGSAALAILMLPTITRASEEILRTVPDPLREASLALGAPHWRTTARIVLPTAQAGLVTAVILGIARAVGETAPMLLTAFGADTTNTSPLNGPQGDLPLAVWKLIRQPNQTANDRAWAGALVLVGLVLGLFIIARWFGNRSARRLGRAR